jgi:hypothetical protein
LSGVEGAEREDLDDREAGLGWLLLASPCGLPLIRTIRTWWFDSL